MGVSYLEIYDRYGAIIFSSQNSNLTQKKDPIWDGHIGSDMAPPDVYLARAVLILSDGTQREIVWNIYLIL